MSNGVEIELTTELQNQKKRYWRTQPVSVLVGCVPASVGNTQTVFLSTKQDGEFLSELLTISAIGPVNANGLVSAVVPTVQTGFPSGRRSASNVDLAARGVSMRITEVGSGRVLTDGYVPLELIGTPGYGTFMREAFPFRYTFRKEAKLQIELVNQDIAVLNGGGGVANDAYHKVSFNLVGKKFNNVVLPAGV